MDTQRHKAVCTKAYAIVKEGIESRRTGRICQYQANTVQHFLHGQGWLQEDLRIALMRANPQYAAEQARFGQGL